MTPKTIDPSLRNPTGRISPTRPPRRIAADLLRRIKRLTNGFSKTLASLKAAVALHFAYYNFVRIHGSLGVTPAMEAGVTRRLWNVEDLLKG